MWVRDRNLAPACSPLSTYQAERWASIGSGMPARRMTKCCENRQTILRFSSGFFTWSDANSGRVACLSEAQAWWICKFSARAAALIRRGRTRFLTGAARIPTAETADATGAARIGVKLMRIRIPRSKIGGRSFVPDVLFLYAKCDATDQGFGGTGGCTRPF